MGRKSKPFDYKKVDIYLAGLFDGEGCVTYSNPLKLRKGKKKAYAIHYGLSSRRG